MMNAQLLNFKKKFELDRKSLVFAPLAQSYRKVGMISEAMSILREGLKYNPHYKAGHIVLAECYTDLEKYDLAYKVIRPYVESDLDNLLVQKLFILLCGKTNREEECKGHLQKLIQYHPKDKFFAGEMARFQVSEIAEVRPTKTDVRIEEYWDLPPLLADAPTQALLSPINIKSDYEMDQWESRPLPRFVSFEEEKDEEEEEENKEIHRVPIKEISQKFHSFLKKIKERQANA